MFVIVSFVMNWHWERIFSEGFPQSISLNSHVNIHVPRTRSTKESSLGSFQKGTLFLKGGALDIKAALLGFKNSNMTFRLLFHEQFLAAE